MTAKNGSLVLAMALALVPAIARAQAEKTPLEPTVSPVHSQNASTVQKDKSACFASAKKETGYDPEAAGGAAAKGSSGLASSKATAKDQAQMAAGDEKLAAYYKAYGSCMKEHGYTVKQEKQ
jgi:hypothetical protein